jgi:hypothetical protein
VKQQPILFILFNRLGTAQKVFAEIKKYQPAVLYISADGHRPDKNGEEEVCKSVREWVLTNIDWRCKVKTLFHEKNLGCGRAPSAAISWFFENEEQGIILEDDCVPSQNFFLFCEQMLTYYKDNSRISIISGCNFDTSKTHSTSDSYFYSVFPYTWGWATWRRNWEGYDYSISKWKNTNQKKMLAYLFKEKKYVLAWKKIFDKLSRDVPDDIWDYQFFFQCFKRKQLSVVPSVNLVTNIGGGNQATHTVNDDNPKINLKTEAMIFPLVHPKELKRNFKYDIFLQKLNYGVIEQVAVFNKIKRIIKKQIKTLKKYA